MAFQYDENPLLFLNSTSSAAPDGRNVRTKSRVQLAAAQQATYPPGLGDYAVLDFRKKRAAVDNSHSAVKRSRKQKSRAGETSASPKPSCALTTQPQRTTLVPLYRGLAPSLIELHPWARIQNPSNVLVVAAFHIRRMTAMALRGRPERLIQVLRFRQWSCVPTAVGRFGTNACLDSALACLALKLDRMTGGSASYRALLATHSEALHRLQSALNEAHRYELRDLFTATQLLAVFEMLDSLDNDVWLQHVAGAGSLLLAKTSGSVKRRRDGLISGIVVPMITDALLSNNIAFLSQYGLQTALRSLPANSAPSGEAEMGFSLLNALQLILDANKTSNETVDLGKRYDLLDRAHILKAQLQTSLKSDAYAQYDFGKVESFDKLGLSVAVVLALNRLIASLRPPQFAEWDSSDEEKTNALCAQLLQLELGEANGNPAMELLSAFQLSK